MKNAVVAFIALVLVALASIVPWADAQQKPSNVLIWCQNTNGTSSPCVAGNSLDYDSGGGTVNQGTVGMVFPASGGPVAASTGAGNTGTGVQRVIEATDSQLSAGVGATGDAAATAGGTGSLNAKMRLLTDLVNQVLTELGQKTEPANTQAISAASLPLPTGAATSANQDGIIKDGTGDTTQANVSNGNVHQNIARINDVVPLMGAGNTGTGSPRVTIATDQSALPGMGVYVEDAAETAGGNLSMAGTVRRDTAATSSSASGDNSTLNTDASGLLWTRTFDPCSAGTKLFVPISQTTGTQLLTGTASNRTYICSIVVSQPSSSAQTFSLVNGTGTVCATSTAAMIGATTAANGMQLPFSHGSGSSSVAKSTVNADNVCLLQSSTDRIAGVLSYVVAP